MDSHISKTKISGKYSLPWLSVTTKRLIRKKQRIYNKAKSTSKPQHWAHFRTIRKQCQKSANSDYWNYVNQLIDPEEKGKTTKNLFSFIKSRKQDNAGVSTLKSNGDTHINSKSKAEALNNQFSSVFTKEDVSDIPDKGQSPHPDLPPIKITNHGVEKLLNGIKPHKATGPDEIPGRILKECATQLSPILAFIYQQSLDTGEVPPDWRTANIVPIFKKGNRSKPANYSSLLPSTFGNITTLYTQV